MSETPSAAVAPRIEQGLSTRHQTPVNGSMRVAGHNAHTLHIRTPQRKLGASKPIRKSGASSFESTGRQPRLNGPMISRFTVALLVALLGVALFVPSAHAQMRGGLRASAAPRRPASSFRLGGSEGFARSHRRRFSNESGFLFPLYFYPDDEIDNEPVAPETPPTPMVVAQPASPVSSPIESLVLENREGQWVRVPTGNEMAIAQSGKLDGAQPSSPQAGSARPAEAPTPLPQLPPAVIVFRDGHMEQIARYMIQGGLLYTSADYWSTGSWTRKIPLAELDIPASLKLNTELGTKFSLPSGPNEVMVRF